MDKCGRMFDHAWYYMTAIEKLSHNFQLRTVLMSWGLRSALTPPPPHPITITTVVTGKHAVWQREREGGKGNERKKRIRSSKVCLTWRGPNLREREGQVDPFPFFRHILMLRNKPWALSCQHSPVYIIKKCAWLSRRKITEKSVGHVTS